MVKIISTIAVRFLSALILTLWAGAAFADKRVALVVGNSQYARASLKLVTPTNDAQDLAQALREIGFDVILRTDVGKSNFDQALVDFARKAKNADTALVYYAGHGLQRNGKNYFLPIDIDAQDEFDFNYRTVSQDSILDAVSQAKSVKIVVLDACRDNPLARQFVASRSWGGGLARIDSAEETVIAYATAPGRVADDGVGHSPFAAALIKRIKEPGLEIMTMFRRVASDVYEKTNGTQQPEITSSLRTDYFLNPAESDSEAWSRVFDSTNPADFKEFIKKFPASPFAREAQYRIDLLERIRSETEEAKAAKKEAERLALEAENKREKEAARKEAERLVLEAEKKRREEDARKEAIRLAVDAERKRLEEEARKEAEHLALEAERQRKEEAAKLEAERLAFEAEKKRQEEAARKEAERLALAAEKKRQEEAAAKKEAERLALEAEKKRQGEAAKSEAERLAYEAEKKRQAEATAKLEAERIALAAEKKRREEAARQEAERIALAVEKKRREEAAAKNEAERLTLEAEKKRQKEAAKEGAERLAQEAEKKRQEEAAANKEAERLALEAEKRRQEEAARNEAERFALAAEKKRQEEAAAKKEAERVALEAEKKRQEEAAKKEAERLAQEAKNKRQEEAAANKEAERLAQEAQRKQKEEEARKEALRLQEEKRAAEERKIAALQEEDRKRQEIEQEKQRVARICDGDHNALQQLTRTQQMAAIEKLGKDTACPSLKPAIETALKEVARAVKHACDGDRKILGELKENDLPLLKTAVAKMSCEPVRVEGQQRIAKLEDDQKRIQAICADETAKLHAIDQNASPALKQYSEFLTHSQCPSFRAEVTEIVKKIDLRVKAAQTELARLGCYSASINGKFDDATKKSLALYYSKKGSLADPDHLGDGVVSELKQQNLGICPEENPPAPVIAKPVQVPTKEQAKKEEEPVSKPSKKPHKVESAAREEEAPVSKPPRHKVHSAAREEEPVSEPPPRHTIRRAAREEEWVPPRHQTARPAPRPPKSYAVRGRASPMPMGRAASSGSPTVIGVGN